MRASKRYRDILLTIGSFMYANWFLVPVGICFYGMSGSYQATQIALVINAFLWFLIGGIINKKI